jgi:hypothetical protein
MSRKYPEILMSYVDKRTVMIWFELRETASRSKSKIEKKLIKRMINCTKDK